MRKYIKKIVIALLVIMSLGILVWRLWPHSFANVISANESAITSLACSVSISGLKDDETPFIDHYQLQASTKNKEDFGAIINILNQSDFCQDFLNLLPWEIISIGSANEEGKTANIFLVWGNAENETCFLTIHSAGKVVVSAGKNNELLVYHATDNSILDKLVNYVQEHGTKIDTAYDKKITVAIEPSAKDVAGVSDYLV